MPDEQTPPTPPVNIEPGPKSKVTQVLDTLDPRLSSIAKWATGLGFAAYVAVVFLNHFIDADEKRVQAEIRIDEKRQAEESGYRAREVAANEETAKAQRDSAVRLAAIEGLTRSFDSTNRLVQETVKALDESQKQACVASKEAVISAKEAAKGVYETNSLLRESTEIHSEQLARLDEIAEETRKQIPASNNKMLIELLKINSGKLDEIIDRSPAKPAPKPTVP